MNTKETRIEGICAGLYVRVIASFERYLRRRIEAVVDELSMHGNAFEAIPEFIRNRNIALTGRLLSSIDEPKDHLAFNYDALVANLASCTVGSKSFRLNSAAFSAAVVGSGPDVLERALKTINVDHFWDRLGANTHLQKIIGTRGPRETGNHARTKLQDLTRKRNQIAHAGDSEPALSAQDVREAIEFIRALATSLDAEVKERITAA